MNDRPDPDLHREAVLVADLAAGMCRTVMTNANNEHVSRAVNAFADALAAGRGNNSDALMALGVIAAVHAHQAAEDCRACPDRTLSVIATVIGMIARNTKPVAIPPDPHQIN